MRSKILEKIKTSFNLYRFHFFEGEKGQGLPTFFSFSFLFRSGTGKSTLLKKLVATAGGESGDISNAKQLYLLNVSAGEAKVYSKSFKGGKETVLKLDSFDQLPETKARSLVLVEDIINMSKDDEKRLRRVLNYDAHHKRQKIFCVSHSIHKTSIWSLLPFFHFIIFTSAASNIPVIRFTLNYFKIDKAQLNSWLERFTALGGGGKLGTYFYFDCLKMSFNKAANTAFTQRTLIGVAGTLSDESPTAGTNATTLQETAELRKRLKDKFDSLVEAFSARAQASAVFSLLLNSLNPTLVRERDLTFAFRSVKRGSEVRLSLVDYVTTLLTREASAPKPLVAFHNYAKKLCHIPKIFCLNKMSG